MEKIKEKYKINYLAPFDGYLFANKQYINCNYYGHIYGVFRINRIKHNLIGPTRIWFYNKKIIYKEFWIDDEYIDSYLKFAKLTNHLICKICNDFCNQNCF